MSTGTAFGMVLLLVLIVMAMGVFNDICDRKKLDYKEGDLVSIKVGESTVRGMIGDYSIENDKVLFGIYADIPPHAETQYLLVRQDDILKEINS